MSDKEAAILKLKELQTEINQHMEEFFESADAKLCIAMTSHGEDALDKLRTYSALPGKRVRGALAIIGYEMYGGTSRKSALDLAVAIELIQNYLLIIDDVMDRSPTRRGADTIHMQYQCEMRDDHDHSDAQHLGNMLAINIGLIAQHLASDILARLDEEPRNVLSAVSLFHRNIAATCYGQIEDLYNDALKKVDEEAIRRVQTLKNSYYTFINPLQVGAALAGKNGTELKQIYDFGIPAGIAFQIRDDIIGLFGEEEDTGKSSMDDLKEGKMTLLMYHALTKGTDQQVAEVQSALGNLDVTEAQHQRVNQIVKDTGGLEHAMDAAREHAEIARDVIAGSEWPDDAKSFISGLMDYIIERDR